jgi:predicted nucleic acid-binding protein
LIAVIDSSITLNWVLYDEHTPESDELFDLVSQRGALVPSLWRLEIANALQVAVRRKRIDAVYRDRCIQELQQLPIQVDSETDKQAWNATLRLSEHHNITVYDAAYLELALRRCLPLATRDQRLAKAACEAGATILPTD